MNGFYSLLIAVSMYSEVPVPSVNWTRERMGYVMCWFPIVGIFCGIALIIWIEVGNLFHLSPEMTGIVAAVVPLLVTGGIHMDGFLDTCDALSSYGEREKKLEILKDPHVGAFGVIACGLYLLICAGVMCELAERGFLLLAVPAFVNVNDGTNEGLKYTGKNIFTVQYHPEACPGPQDSSYLFDRFLKMMEVND